MFRHPDLFFRPICVPAQVDAYYTLIDVKNDR